MKILYGQSTIEANKIILFQNIVDNEVVDSYIMTLKKLKKITDINNPNIITGYIEEYKRINDDSIDLNITYDLNLSITNVEVTSSYQWIYNHIDNYRIINLKNIKEINYAELKKLETDEQFHNIISKIPGKEINVEIYNKLIKDNEPDAITLNGDTPIYHELERKDYWNYLVSKDSEINQDLQNSTNIRECLITKLKLIHELTNLCGGNIYSLLTEAEKEEKENNGFQKKIVLEKIIKKTEV